MQVNHKLKIIEGATLADKERYQRLVEKLIYLSHTRPDIAYVVGIVSQFMRKPQEDHMKAATKIVRYLKGAPRSGIIFKRNGHLKVEAYTDADWADNPNDRRSTAGYLTLVGGNLLADILTKTVSRQALTRVLTKLSIGDPTTHLAKEY
ncbi:uncharacterized mitochondrial protein AtMg00240-like [Arachis hypogaea]|uniref:uncharacterized mitochondrial protein AtMg00240-like n=1 Tax=Arachis hypogaea TaxID=3818 RepID=UPI003B227259